ncbi:MAG: hypothetical protein GF350_13495 [Chitinivibrionales bacterium]|nr:hypothetical protein [Chitinivibrionales bacterium]
MKKSVLAALFPALFFYSSSLYAVSGIGVCDYQNATKHVNGIPAWFVVNDVMVDTIMLVSTEQRLDARFSQINSYGTHCAFIYNDGGWHVAVTRIGGKDKIVKRVCELPDGDKGTGRIWSPILEWPRGDWIWFTSTKDNNEIYRTHVQTGELQHIASVGRTSNQFQLSGDARIVIGAWSESGWGKLPDIDELVASGNNPITFEPEDFLGGCGFGISPSATYAINNNNGFHTRVGINKVDTLSMTLEQDVSVGIDGNIGQIVFGADSMVWMWDEWTLDSTMKNEIYNPKVTPGEYTGQYQVVGRGNLTLGGWSSNSDHWALMVTGWVPGGRQIEESGSNILGLNFMRGEVMPFTHNYCKYDTVNNPDGDRIVAWHGDIWISDPVEDIAPGYIDDFNARRSYQIEGTDQEVAAEHEHLVFPDGVHSRRQIPEEQERYFIDNMTISLDNGQSYSIEIVNSRGQTLFSKSVHAQQSSVPAELLRSGVTILQVRDRNRKLVSRKTCIMLH